MVMQELEKKRQEERMQQKRWQEIHRQQLRAAADMSAYSEAALKRLMNIKDAGRSDWVTIEFETTHLWTQDHFTWPAACS